MHVFFLSVLLFYDAHGYTVSLNSNRKFLFGDVLEPLVSVDLQGKSLKNGELVELFHTWELFSASQVSSGSISDYRKAMPCFPGPNLNTTAFNNDTIPPYPDCETFVNISKTTMGEMEDLMDGIQKDRGGTQMDVSLKTVMNSLVNRMQNLIDFLPEGQTKQTVQAQLFTLVAMSTRTPSFEAFPNSTTPNPFFYSNPPNYSNPPRPPAHQTKFNPSDLLNCFNISSISSTDLLIVATQTVGSVACSRFQICSFSDLSQNSCLGSLNITEKQYDSVVDKTIGGILKDRILGRGEGGGGGGGRFRRTVDPEEGVTPVMKMDGREEDSDDEGGVVDMNYGEIDSEDVLKKRMQEEEEESSGAGSMEEGSGAILKHQGILESSGREVLKDPKIKKGIQTDLESSGGESMEEKIPEYPKIQKRIQMILESSGEGSGGGYKDSAPVKPKKGRKNRKYEPDCCDYTLSTNDLPTNPSSPPSIAPRLVYDFTKDPVEIIGIDDSGVSEEKRQAALKYVARVQEEMSKKHEKVVLEGSGSGSEDPEDPPEDPEDLLERVAKDCCDYTTEDGFLTGESSGAGSRDPEAPGAKDLEHEYSGAESKDSNAPGAEDTKYPESLEPSEAGSMDPSPPGSTNPDPDLLSQDHFSEALGYFGGSSLLHYPLNSSMVEYGISFLNSSDPFKLKLEKILPELGSEFTLMDLLKKLNMTDPSLILNSLGSVFGVEASEISGILKELAGGDLNSMWKKLMDTAENPSENSPGASPSPPSATLQTAILNAIKSNDTASLVSNAMSFLKENPNILEKFKNL